MCRTHQKWKTVTSIIIDEFNVVHHPSPHPIYVVYLVKLYILKYNILWFQAKNNVLFMWLYWMYFVWWVCYWGFSFNFILLKYVVWSLNDFVALQYIQWHDKWNSVLFLLYKSFQSEIEKGLLNIYIVKCTIFYFIF